MAGSSQSPEPGNQGKPLITPRFGPTPGSQKRLPKIRLRAVLIAGTVWLAIIAVATLTWWIPELPSTDDLFASQPGHDVTVLDIKGRTIARRGIQGQPVRVSELPPYVGNAFIAVEDRRFRYHLGIDPIGLMRAAFVDVAHLEFVQGGSTLTQQLAKNLFLTPDRTLRRKIQEAILAVYLEMRYSKDEILGFYLNRVYFGAGVYGIEAASERYFDKPANKLTLTEAAILAGVVKAPSRYNPEASRDAALQRASLVLAAMADAEFIDRSQLIAAEEERPKFARTQGTPGSGYFVDYVISQLPALAPSPKERLIVATTLDLDLQRQAEQALTNALNKEGSKLGASEGALVAMTHDGAIRALVGGASYDDSPFNRAVDAKRQPGSAFKPFVYLAALEHGHQPNDEVVDGPVTIGKWRPGNYEGEYEGQITLARALAHSSNSAAVQLTNEVGADEVVDVAQRLGISDQLNPVPSLALGTSEVTPLELTSAYIAFANGGYATAPVSVLRVRTPSGKVLYQYRKPDPQRVMSPENAAYMTQMMQGTIADGTGTAAALAQYEAAGKTGTSQDYRDAWFIGYTADYVTGVWIGNDDGSAMHRATGGGLPARAFHNFMLAAERGHPPKPLPALAFFTPEDETPPAAQPDGTPAETPKPEQHDDVLKRFQNLLDRLF